LTKPPERPIRYGFGKNWQEFLDTVDDESIARSVRSMQRCFGVQDFKGLSFLDIGCGSGLSSLAARRMLASEVFGFDYDEDSVGASRELWRREGSPSNWRICRGDILDPAFVEGLPRFDIVYSWGVLHHTGRMWDAIRSAASIAKPGGAFMIGIYNKKLPHSEWARRLKRIYAGSGAPVRALLKLLYLGAVTSYQLLRGRRPELLQTRTKNPRGMDYWRDLDDWLGGYPFEFATPEQVIDFVGPLGFDLVAAETGTEMARVNEFLFRRHG
jgi:2-polyprenyl-6-hydroxyphenyl methylase/3-demethylubiquinone-9 3-methyltransferase